MATYRCVSCKTLWVSPQGGMTVYHACPEQVDHETQERRPWPNRRDENLVQLTSGGPVHMKSLGLGRELISELDVLAGASLERIRALQAGPHIGLSPLPEEDLNKGRPEAVPGPG